MIRQAVIYWRLRYLIYLVCCIILYIPWDADSSALLPPFCPQSIVPDLSYTVRSPMLDTWEGIKQLKAALWALVCVTCS